MRTAAVIILVALCGVFLYQVMRPADDAVAYTPPDNLRDAMQERMADLLRMHAQLESGESPTPASWVEFAGLPHSEFVNDVSQYQEYFVVFDEFYAQISQSPDARNQFNLVVQSCIACHQNVCPGPLRAMNRLILE